MPLRGVNGTGTTIFFGTTITFNWIPLNFSFQVNNIFLSDFLNAFCTKTNGDIIGTMTYRIKNTNTYITTDTNNISVGNYDIEAILTYNGNTGVIDTEQLIISQNKQILTIYPEIAGFNYIPYNDSTRLRTYMLQFGAYYLDKRITGTFSYKIGGNTITSSTILEVGNYNIEVIFTPYYSTSYENATSTKTLTITKATPALNWTPISSSINYNNSLVDFLNGTSPTSGTFSYLSSGNTITSSTILNVGTYSVTTTFIPTDINNYNNVTSTKTLTITKQHLH